MPYLGQRAVPGGFRVRSLKTKGLLDLSLREQPGTIALNPNPQDRITQELDFNTLLRGLRYNSDLALLRIALVASRYRGISSYIIVYYE